MPELPSLMFPVFSMNKIFNAILIVALFTCLGVQGRSQTGSEKWWETNLRARTFRLGERFRSERLERPRISKTSFEAFPGAPAKIVFSDSAGSSDPGDTDIYWMYEDGTGLTRVTSGATRDVGPSWDGAGVRIVFTRAESNSFTTRLYTVLANGEGLNEIPVSVRISSRPIWSPSGSRVAFVGLDSLNQRGIYSVNTDGSDLRRHYARSGIRNDITYSPDGTKIAFSCLGCEPYPVAGWRWTEALYDINTSLTDQPSARQLGLLMFPFLPTYSPDGSKIAVLGSYLLNIVEYLNSPPFTVTPQVVGGIMLINSDGSNAFGLPPSVQPLPYQSSGQTMSMSWSDDGTKIALLEAVSGGRVLKTIDSNGGNPQTLRVLNSLGELTSHGWQRNIQNCNYAFSIPDQARDFPQAGGSAAISVVTNRRFCGWTVTSDASWIEVINGTGNDSRSVTFNVASNSGASRSELLKLIPGGSDPHPGSPIINQAGLGPNTPAGSNVTFTSGDVRISFSSVTSSGFTSISPIPATAAGALPHGFQLTSPPIAFEVNTTAQFTGPVDVCFANVLVSDIFIASRLRVFHGEMGQLIDRTFSYNPTNREICARVSSLSPFVVAIEPADTTPPIITPVVSGQAGNGGWYKSDVDVVWDVTDGESDVQSSSGCGATVISSDTAGVTLTCSATSAGGTGTNSVTIRRDATPPVISLLAPVAGRYLLNQSVTADYSCQDAMSGVAQCNGFVPSGTALNTSNVGTRNFTVFSSDSAGNEAAPTSISYSVVYGVQALFDQTKAHKSGSNVPVKLRLIDANGVNMSSSSIVVHAAGVLQTSTQASTNPEDSGNSNPDYDFRYDPELSAYVFNLKTTGYGTGAYLLNFVVGNESTVYSVGFQVVR